MRSFYRFVRVLRNGEIVEIGSDPVINDLLPKKDGVVTDYWPVLNCYAYDGSRRGIVSINIEEPKLIEADYVADVSIYTDSSTEHLSLFVDIENRDRSVYQYPETFGSIEHVFNSVKIFANKDTEAFLGDGFRYIGKENGPDNTTKYKFELFCGSINDKSGTITPTGAYAAVNGSGKQYFVECTSIPAPVEFTRNFDNSITSVKFNNLTTLSGDYGTSGNPWTIYEDGDGFRGCGFSFEVKAGHGVNRIQVSAYTLDGEPLYERDFYEVTSKSCSTSGSFDSSCYISARGKLGDILPDDAGYSVSPGHAADRPRGCYFIMSAVHANGSAATNPEDPIKVVVYYVVADANEQTVTCADNEVMCITKENPVYNDPSAHRYYFICGTLDN